MEERQIVKPHKVLINNRKSAAISGVKDVISFDLEEVLLETELGNLHIKGNDLHVSRLSIEKGEIDVEGTINSMEYSNSDKYGRKGESFVKRMFK